MRDFELEGCDPRTHLWAFVVLRAVVCFFVLSPTRVRPLVAPRPPLPSLPHRTRGIRRGGHATHRLSSGNTRARNEQQAAGRIRPPHAGVAMSQHESTSDGLAHQDDDSHAAPAPAAPAAAAVAPSTSVRDDDAGQWQTVPIKASKHAMDRASSLTVPEHSKSARESRRGSQNANAAQAAQIKAAGGRRNSQPNVAAAAGQHGLSSASTPPTPGSRRLSASGLAAEDFASFRKGHVRGSHAQKATEWRRGSLEPADAEAAAAAAAAGGGALSPPPLHPPHLPRVPSKGKQMNQQHTPVKGGGGGGDAKRTPKSRGSRSPAVLSPSPQNVGGKDASAKDGRASPQPAPSVQHSVGHSRFSLGPTDFPNLSFRRVMWAAERKGGKNATGAAGSAAPATNRPESSGEATPMEREATGGSSSGAGVDLTQRLPVESRSGIVSGSQSLPAASPIKPQPVVITAPPRSFLAAASAGFGPRSSPSSSGSGTSPGSSAPAASPLSASASASASVPRAARPTPAVVASPPAAAVSFVPIIPILDDEELASIAPISAPSRAVASSAGTEVAASAVPAAHVEAPPVAVAAAPAALSVPSPKLSKKQKSPRVAVANEATTVPVAGPAAPVVDVAAAVGPAHVPAAAAAPAPAALIVSPKSARAAVSPKGAASPSAAAAAAAPSRPAPTTPKSSAATAKSAAGTAASPKSSGGGTPKSHVAVRSVVADKAEETPAETEVEGEEEEEEEAAVESPRAAAAQAAESDLSARRSSILPAPVASALASLPPAQLLLFAIISLMLLVASLVPPRARFLVLCGVAMVCVGLCAFHRLRVLRNKVPQPWRARLEEAVGLGIRTPVVTSTTKGATHSRDKLFKKKSKKR